MIAWYWLPITFLSGIIIGVIAWNLWVAGFFVGSLPIEPDADEEKK